MKIKGIASLTLLTVLIVFGSAGANLYSLYSDQRAMRVDDILTIIIEESAKAGSQSNTNTSKENSMDLDGGGGTGVLGFIPRFGASGGSKVNYGGKGGTSRQGSLVATISARVVEVLDNGNLIIEGSKVVEINEEKEIIKLTGMVRPADILKNNVIYSSSIADAEITYTGKGVANTGQRPGFLARFINWIF
ncbi:MAG TPA: flagellar basal body L-ring protein FlgH [Chitinispirillaceae bacterium]|jgi:flagellar L-ring protein precursor FlgH|nr:flagellar basal body L-ring protein FlgH [Chitinispirillaceae bacterium]